MVFSSASFLYWFLPVFLMLYALIKKAWRNAFLLCASLLFYLWGEQKLFFLPVVSTLLAWGMGFVLEKHRGTQKGKLYTALGAALLILPLALFKYADFIIETANSVFLSGDPIGLLRLALPLGISFYTFQLLSYVFDVYRAKINAERNLLSFATYAMMFPQILSGPIVRYAFVRDDIKACSFTLENLALGAQRFVLGLAKKVLLANAMGELCAAYKSGGETSLLFTWLYLFAYGFQIYYDFSGYSDMAIGLARVMGFSFPENFNYPYISKSVTEFWRRWHITLGSWFRDYVYIPLGGNRVKPLRHVLNILAVWLLTGLWHGASWGFVAWGLYFALFLLLEKYVYGKLLQRLPAAFSHAFTLLLLLVSWNLFDAQTLNEAFLRIGHMFGANGIALSGARSVYFLKSYWLLLLIAGVGATPLPKRLMQRIESGGNRFWSGALSVAAPAALTALLIISTAYIIDGSFSPFIYFRF